MQDGTPDQNIQDSAVDQTPEPTKKPDTTPLQTKTQEPVQGEDINSVIAKARADEKKKMFSKLDAIQNEKLALEKQQAELKRDLDETKSKLDGIREGKMSELKSVNEELAALREHNTKLEKAVEEVASTAAQRIYESELKSYRESKIRESGVKIPELVTGATKDEIDEAIKAAVARENTMRESLREDVRKEIAATLPGPLDLDGTQGRVSSGVSNSNGRVSMAKLRGEDYAKARQQLLEEAKQKVGL